MNKFTFAWSKCQLVNIGCPRFVNVQCSKYITCKFGICESGTVHVQEECDSILLSEKSPVDDHVSIILLHK